jgi:hypothetical protein
MDWRLLWFKKKKKKGTPIINKTQVVAVAEQQVPGGDLCLGGDLS